MADLPRYGTQTPRVSVADIGVHRMRGLEDAGFAALQGSKSAADVSEYFMRQVERANIQEAEQNGAVVARDDQGNLAPINLRNSSSPASVAFNNAQRQAWTAAAAADAAAQFKAYAQRSINPVDEQGKPMASNIDPIQSFDTQASNYIAAAVKDRKMPDDVRSSLVTRIGQIAAEHRTWVVDQVHNRNVLQITSQLEADQNRIIGEAIVHARNGNSPAAERSRNDFAAAVQGIADIDPRFGAAKQQAALNTFDAAVYFSGVERKALAAYQGAAGFRESGMGRAAGLRVVDAAMNDGIAKFGPDLANAWMSKINAKIQLEASVRDSVDAINMRRQEEAFFAASINLSGPVLAALKGNGENPQTVLHEQGRLIYEQFKSNPQLARLFQNRFIQTYNERTMDWSPSVLGAAQGQSEWFSSIKAAVASGDIDPQSVVPMMLNEFEKGTLPFDPKFDAVVRTYASNAEVTEINKDRAEARAEDREFQRNAKANAREILTNIRKENEKNEKRMLAVNLVRDTLEGRNNPLSANSEAAKALDVVWSGWEAKPETHAPMMVEMMLRGGGMSAQVLEDLRGLIKAPTEGMLRKYGPMLGLMMNSPDIKSALVDTQFASAEDRAKLTRLWGEMQQHIVNMQDAGADQARLSVEKKRFNAELRDIGKSWADSAIKGPQVRAAVPNFDGQVAAAGAKAVSELSSIGVDALDGWLGLSQTPGRAVFGGYEGSVKPFQTGYNLSQSSKVVQSAVEGLSLLFGGNPFSGFDVAAGLPIIGWAFETAPVTMNPVDKARLASEVSSRALEMGGDINGAAANAKRAWQGSGYRPSFYSGANNAQAFNPNAKYVAEWTLHPIDGGPGGPMVARSVLAPLADRAIQNGFKFADETVTNGIQAVSKPGLWKVSFDSFGSVEKDGKKIDGRSYDVRVLADTGKGEKTLVPIGKVFVPNISDAQLQSIRSNAELEAKAIIDERNKNQPEPSASVLRGMTREQWIRQIQDPFRMATVADGRPLSAPPMSDQEFAATRPSGTNYNEVKMLAKWLEIGQILSLARSGTVSSP